MENIQKAIDVINRLYQILKLDEKYLGVDSPEAINARGRWVTACKMYEIFTGSKWQIPIDWGVPPKGYHN